MNLLITGGAGFIGSNLIHHVINQPGIAKLVNLDCLTYAGHLENLAAVASHPKYVFEKVDLRDKAETLSQFGEAQFTIWRRSFDTPPPPVNADSKYHPANDPRYRDLAPEQLPATEALSHVLDRMLPYWYDAVVPDLRAGRVTLIAAHGNSLRALVMHLNGLSKDEVVALNIPTGIPLRFELDDALRPISSEYLDPEAAVTAAAKVASQGKK